MCIVFFLLHLEYLISLNVRYFMHFILSEAAVNDRIYTHIRRCFFPISEAQKVGCVLYACGSYMSVNTVFNVLP